MPNRDDILREARSWIGTPFHHQQCVKGIGVDCAMLVMGVGVALGLAPVLPAHQRAYGRLPKPERMRAIIAEYLDPVEGDPRPGDILYMGWLDAARPMHMGFLTDLHGRGLLHSSQPDGGVVETALPASYEPLIDSWWRYRGID